MNLDDQTLFKITISDQFNSIFSLIHGKSFILSLNDEKIYDAIIKMKFY